VRIRRDWRWLWAVTLLTTAVLPVGFGIVACGKNGAPAADQTAPAPTPDPLPIPGSWPDCGPGLAAAPLAPPCRAKPQATMGALEAVGS